MEQYLTPLYNTKTCYQGFFSVNFNRNFMIILPVPDQVSTAGK